MSDSDRDDEVAEVRRAMREARARKKCMENKLKGRLSKDSQERAELEGIIRDMRQELEISRKTAQSNDYDLKEARYQISQLNSKIEKLKDERELMITVNKNQLLELQLKTETSLKQNEEKHHLLALETEKVGKIMERVMTHVEVGTSKNQVLRTQQHLLEKIVVGINKIKEINAGSKDFATIEYRKIDSSNNGTTVDSAVDAALLDMCRNLEDENVALNESIESLKSELADVKRQATASQLIPHYRLAIVRARSYASNLIEQLQREKETSKKLQEQLDETYADLQKVVEEKRRLYQRVSKKALQEFNDTGFKRSQHDVILHPAIDDMRLNAKSKAQHLSPKRTNGRHEEGYTDDVSSGRDAFVSGTSSSSAASPVTLPHPSDRAGLHCNRANNFQEEDEDEDYLFRSRQRNRSSSAGISSAAYHRHRENTRSSASRSRSRSPSASAKSHAVAFGTTIAATDSQSSQRHSVRSSRSRSRSPQPRSNHGVDQIAIGSDKKHLLVQHLQGDLNALDSQIELIKAQLGQAAVRQSQRILTEVLDGHLVGGEGDMGRHHDRIHDDLHADFTDYDYGKARPRD